MPMRWWTDAHFCWFLTVLEYSPIGKKFPLATSPCTLYTVKKKNLFPYNKAILMKKNVFDTIAKNTLYKRKK